MPDTTAPPPASESGVRETDAAAAAVLNAPTTFKLYRHGPVTVIGWDGAAAVDAHPEDFLQEAADLVSGADAETLAVDLGGLTDFRPGLLGGLAALVRRETRVLLFDPTDDVRQILAYSHLDRLLSVHSSKDGSVLKSKPAAKTADAADDG